MPSAQREQKSALEIAFGQRATDAAQNEKRTDDEKTHGVAEIALPINEGIFGQFAPQRGSEKFIHDGQNVHHIEHEVIEHHQNDAKTAQKIQFPEPLFALFRKARDPRPEIIRFYSVVAHSAL